MGQSAMLVTSDGKRVLPETDAFFSTLGQLAPGTDPIGFAVRKLGFVKFQQFDDRVTVVEYDPESVGRCALLRAERRIGESRAGRFVVKKLGANCDVSLSAVEAIAQLRELRAPPREKTASTARFAVEPRDCATLLRERDHPLSRLGWKWCECSGAFDSSFMGFARDIGVLPRLMIFGVKPRTEDVVFRFIGEGHDWLTRRCRADPIGEPVENQPDKEYGAWVGQFHRSVARTGEPRCDLVSATFRFAEELEYTVRYERLLLPWKTASDETLVTVVSRVIWRDGDGSPAVPN